MADDDDNSQLASQYRDRQAKWTAQAEIADAKGDPVAARKLRRNAQTMGQKAGALQPFGLAKAPGED